MVWRPSCVRPPWFLAVVLCASAVPVLAMQSGLPCAMAMAACSCRQGHGLLHLLPDSTSLLVPALPIALWAGTPQANWGCVQEGSALLGGWVLFEGAGTSLYTLRVCSVGGRGMEHGYLVSWLHTPGAVRPPADTWEV